MHPTSSRPRRGPDGTRTGYRPRQTNRTLLAAFACLAALGCLAGFVIAKLHKSPSGSAVLSWPTARPTGTSASAAGSAAPLQDRLAALVEDALPERSVAAERAAELARETWRSVEELNVLPALALEALFVSLRHELHQ